MSLFYRTRLTAVLPVACLAFVACSEDPAEPEPTPEPDPVVGEITFAAGDALGLYAGESLDLGVSVIDTSGAALDTTITWSVSGPGVVTVTPDGTLIALAQGTATVTASVGTVSKSAQVRVTEFVEISALFDPVCARDVDGAVWCVGTAWNGHLIETPPFYETWTKISGDLVFTSLASGLHYTCGMAGQVYCWGSNEDGRLGDPSILFSSTPLAVAGQPELVSVDGGHWHSCGLDVSGDAYCWGRGAFGELGHGEPVIFAPPAIVDADHTWQTVDAADRMSCGIGSDDGKVYCWGRIMALGGDDFASPVAIDSLPTNLEILKADWEVCGSIGADIHCWGRAQDEPSPDQVTMPDAVVDFEIGDQSVCALLASGDIYCWGSNADDLLGDPALTSSATPVRIDAGGRKFVAITGEWSMHCGLAEDGGVWCWGGGSLIDRPFPHTDVPTRVPAPMP